MPPIASSSDAVAARTSRLPLLYSPTCRVSNPSKPVRPASVPVLFRTGKYKGSTPFPKVAWQAPTTASKSARGESSLVMTTARGMPTFAHSSHSMRVAPSIPSTADITNIAASAARRPARRSPTKSAYPGASRRLILTPLCSTGAKARETERWWRTSASSKSVVVVPSSTRPALGIAPLATSRASTRVVLPTPEWPTSTTFRILPGWSTVGAVPAAPAGPVALSDMSHASSARGLRNRLSTRSAAATRVCAGEGLMRLRRRRAGLAGLAGVPGGRTGRPRYDGRGKRSFGPTSRWTAKRTDMLKRVRVPLQRVLGPLGQALARRGVNPNVVTAVGATGVCASALICYPRGWLFWGSFAITFFVLTDLVDGALARARGITGPWGAFLDSSLDRIADSAVFAGLIWWFARDGKPVLLGLCIFCLVAGNLVSYTRARAEGLGLRADIGIAERTERTIVILVATGLSGLGIPFVQVMGLWLLAAGSAITVAQRFAVVYTQAHAVPDPHGDSVAPAEDS